ncbi:MAG: nuclear transport factor 2 family protein [Gelidibacter sp.]
MKNLFLLGLAIVLFTSCEKQDKRYTQQSPEIDTYKKSVADYENQDWEALRSHYADTAKIMNNTTKEHAQTVDQMIAQNKEDAALFDSWKYDPESVEYEMVVTDKGQTWVNFWGYWEGTLKANGQKYVIPAHITAQFVDGKIVREDGYWDPTKIVLALQEIEAEKNMPTEEKTMKSLIDSCVKAWNDNDKDLMASIMTDDFVRTENGNVIAKSASEYGTNLMDVFHGSFPDFKVLLNDYKIVGNTIHIDWTCKGTNTKPFQGNAATNKAITTHGHSIWTVTNGKLSREDAYYDNLTLFAQLGYSAPAPPK